VVGVAEPTDWPPVPVGTLIEALGEIAAAPKPDATRDDGSGSTLIAGDGLAAAGVTELPGAACIRYPVRSGADGLRLYLAEANRTRLLTAEEEIALAQQIETGRGARERIASGLADPAEVAALWAIVDRGEGARCELINGNLRLVVALARQHVGPGVELADLIQEGNLGLMKAVERFDWRKGNRFATYALWWIRQAVSSAVVERSRSIRLPSHVVDSLGRLSRTEQRLTQELGRQPSDLEVCDSLGISCDRLTGLRRALERPTSLEARIGEDGESELIDVIADESTPTPLSALLSTSLREQVDLALSSLSPRERLVISLRFGLSDDESRTLEEVGRIMGITKERVRQLEARSLRKLRQASRSRWLVEYVD
jgi:RNA polymerase primary sigma factor